MKQLSKFILTALLCAVVAVSFMPMAPFAYAADEDTDSDEYTLTWSGGITQCSAFYYDLCGYPNYPVEFSNGDTFTVTQNGVSTDFVFKFSDFYDKDWKTPVEHGYALCYKWLDDYDFSYDVDVSDIIGSSYNFQYFICRVNEDGYPIDAEGDPIQDAEGNAIIIVNNEISSLYLNDNDSVKGYAPIYYKSKFQTDVIDNNKAPAIEKTVLAKSQVITVTAKDNLSFATVKGIVYGVEEGESNAELIMPEDGYEPKGALTLPSKVTIDGKSYPMTTIQGSPGLCGCSGITSIKIPSTVRYIHPSALSGTGLKSISVPTSVIEVGSMAFGYDSDGSKISGFVVYTETNTEAEEYAFANGFKTITEKTAKKWKPKLKRKALKKRKVRLTWSKKKYATGYQIYQKTKKKGKFKKVATIKNAKTTKWTSKKLSKKLKGKRVYYKVRTYTVIGTKTYYGKWSKTVSAKVRK